MLKMSEHEVAHPLTPPKMRAERVKEARKLARLTLREMAGDGFINYNTLCGWESAKHGGLTEKGAAKVVERLQKEGVSCSVEWLMEGIGEPPHSLTQAFSVQHTPVTAEQFLQEHTTLFRQLYPHFLSLVLPDESMSPQYHAGDFVAGPPLPLDRLVKVNGQIVIAKLQDGRVVLRQLMIDVETGDISLVAAQPKSLQPVIAHVRLQACALVCCHLGNVEKYL